MSAEEYLKQGDLQQALEQLQKDVRKAPADARLRIFLFQLLSVMGQWDRALTQLNVAGELDDGALAMVCMYREVLTSERFREEVFEGKRDPVMFGHPEQWIALLIQALKMTAQGRFKEAQTLRHQALEQAPAISGQINGQPFEWLADSDGRLGPLLEAMIEGRYFWIPLQRIRLVTIEPPEDLRDLVWLPAHFRWSNGGESYGLIPNRYPASYRQDDPLIALARKTEWIDCGDDTWLGYGQRLLVSDTDEYPLMDVRTIELNSPDESVEPTEASNRGQDTES